MATALHHPELSSCVHNTPPIALIHDICGVGGDKRNTGVEQRHDALHAYGVYFFSRSVKRFETRDGNCRCAGWVSHCHLGVPCICSFVEAAAVLCDAGVITESVLRDVVVATRHSLSTLPFERPKQVTTGPWAVSSWPLLVAFLSFSSGLCSISRSSGTVPRAYGVACYFHCFARGMCPCLGECSSGIETPSSTRSLQR